MGATKPFIMPNKPPLVLKIDDKVSIKCLYVPPGRFYMGCPLIQVPHWQESPQHMVTLTRGFYLSETPITYEQYGAVTGDTTAGSKTNYNPQFIKRLKSPELDMDPQSSAGLSCQMYKNFCAKIKEKTGKKVRMPTFSEWEWAARCGTSDPSCSPNAARREFPTLPTVEYNPYAPVKKTPPNAWGFYQICVMGSSERFLDGEKFHSTSKGDLVDPSDPVKADDMDPIGKHDWNVHAGGGGADYPIMELLRTGGTRGLPFEDEWNKCHTRQRIVVEEADASGVAK